MMKPFLLPAALAAIVAVLCCSAAAQNCPNCATSGSVVTYYQAPVDTYFETGSATVTYQAVPTITETAPVYYYATPTIIAPRIYGQRGVIFGPTLAPAPPIYYRPAFPRLWLYRYGF